MSKAAFLTGVTGGLGLSLAKVLLEQGYRVFGGDVAVDRPEVKELNETYKDRFITYPLDVTDDASINSVAEQIEKLTDKLDRIFNVAGILPSNSEKVLEEFDINGSIRVFDVNSLGPLRIVKRLLPLLEKGEDKVIVNISSEAGSMTTHADYINRYDYCMSKAAVNIQTVILQRYLKPRGIKLLAVHPGWMRTSMGGNRAPVLPMDAAKGINHLADVYKGKLDDLIYMDYDGTPRAW